MQDAVHHERTVRFGTFELDPESEEIRKGGLKLKLTGQPYQVLNILLEDPGRVVSREELQKRLWPDTFVDFDHNLNAAINKIREVLGDSAENPRFIETLPRRGYRFIAPVHGATRGNAQESVPPEAGTESVEPGAKRYARKLGWVSLAVAAVVVFGAAGLIRYLRPPLPTLRISSYKQIASVGQWADVAGTDGSSIYVRLFLPNGSGVVPVSGGRVVPFAIDLPTSRESPNDVPLIFNPSPDGSKLLVGSNLDSSSGRKLWVVDAHGGGARYLAKGYSVSWSPDGTTVLYSNLHGDIYTISSEGGEPRLLLASPVPPGAPLPLSGFAWSPDKSRIRFVRDARYWEISADGKNKKEILPNWHASSPRYFMAGGRWTPDGEFFLFLGGVAGFSQNLADARQLWSVSERRNWSYGTDPEPVQLSEGATIWGAITFSKDGKTVYCTGMNPRGELVRYDTKSRELVPYLGGISAEYISFSRDGKYVAYVAYPEGTMWRANRDGSGIQQLTGPPFHPTALEWSPDGTQILFSELEPNHRGAIYLISSQGGTPRLLLPGDRRWGTSPDWSPDGKRIVFDQVPIGSLFVGTAIWVYHGDRSRVLELETGKISDLPPCPKPCFSPRWSPNGRYILQIAADHKSLLIIDLRTGRCSQIDLTLGAINFARWSHDGRSIYFQDSDLAGVVRSTAPGIYRYLVTGGSTEKVVDLKGFRGTGSLTVGWFGLDPQDRPLLLRNVGTYDIYALTLERK